MAKPPKTPLTVETLKNVEAQRRNIPTAEYQSVMAKDELKPTRVEYERRNRDLDPQLVWRGKDEQDWSNLVVHAPPLYIQEKVHPKVLVDDLKRQSELPRQADALKPDQFDLFADFNGLPTEGAKTEFYQHDGHWANRMILGDSLAVMASLAEREGLRGKVQCIYFDPPYGIKFNSNFQWSTTSRDMKDGNVRRQCRSHHAGTGAGQGISGYLAIGSGTERSFVQIILENLKTAGVQQANKADKIVFTALTPWPGDLVCADGRYVEGQTDAPGADVPAGREKRAAVFIGPEFGTVSRPDLVAAAREAGDAGFDVLIACAFNYDAHASEFAKLGRIPVLKARMNADLHMAEDLKNTGKGNLFVIFGEPDIDILPADVGQPGGSTAAGQIRVKINGVDVFHPNAGEVRSDGADGIACWFIDTDYNEESFFVRHAYFLGANDPYKALKTTLKAAIASMGFQPVECRRGLFGVPRPGQSAGPDRLAGGSRNRLQECRGKGRQASRIPRRRLRAVATGQARRGDQHGHSGTGHPQHRQRGPSPERGGLQDMVLLIVEMTR